jgi:hypothetical protein
MKKVNLHGDITLYPIDTIKPPKTAKSAKLHILQNSGTTGNRHEVVSKKSPIYRWTKDGVEYISCKEDYIIRHIGGDCEHGEQPVEAGTRKLLHEMEHNPWTSELRVVID